MSLDPSGAVLRLAARAESLSQRMSQEAAQLGTRVRATGWKGPAADAHLRRTEHLMGDLRRNAAELDEVAAALRAHALTAAQGYEQLAQALAKGVELVEQAGQSAARVVTP